MRIDKIEDRLYQYSLNQKQEVPEEIHAFVGATLASLPERKEKRVLFTRRVRPAYVVMAMLAAVVIVLNTNPQIAYAMERIPGVEYLIRVVTLNHYFIERSSSELDVEVSHIQTDGVAGDAADAINKEVNDNAEKIIQEYQSEVEKDADVHTATRYSYETVTDTKRWFTLKITTEYTAASSSVSYKYYHIDKNTGDIIRLLDLFQSNCDYKSALSENIKAQMRKQMSESDNVAYCLDSELPETDFKSIDEDANYYIGENGNLVIVFDEYEVAPGYMGTPEFVIPYEVYEGYLKPEYKTMLK